MQTPACVGTLTLASPTHHHKNPKPVPFPNSLEPFSDLLWSYPALPRKLYLVSMMVILFYFLRQHS